jgi:hypothetical protein
MKQDRPEVDVEGRAGECQAKCVEAVPRKRPTRTERASPHHGDQLDAHCWPCSSAGDAEHLAAAGARLVEEEDWRARHHCAIITRRA